LTSRFSEVGRRLPDGPIYALARDLGEPLLFKGDDLALTDIELVTTPYRQRRLSEVVAGYGAPPT
jgi:hypothetical protein